MPTITLATCFILLITWVNPGPCYAGELEGMAWVDGNPVMLDIVSNGDTAIWEAELQPGAKVVNYAHVVLTVQPGSMAVDNAPYLIACNQVFIPMIEVTP